MKFKQKTLLLIPLFALVACEETRDVERPVGIPQSAVWQGAEDGGDWVDCSVVEKTVNCTLYGHSAENFYQQSYEICGVSNISNWLSVPDGEGLRNIPVLNGNVYLTPLSHAIYFANGEIDLELTEKSKREFAKHERRPCEVKLFVNEPN